MSRANHSSDVLALAPMRGLTGQIYRNAFVRRFGGLDHALAPFVPSVKAEKIKASLVKDLRPEVNGLLPVIPQIIGRDPADFVVMAEHLAEMGYEEVNWNLGCPWPMAVTRTRGSGLLARPDLIEALLEHVVGRIRCRLSIKVRLGVDRNDQLLGLAPLINRYALSEVIIHPRTARQMYEGVPDVDMFERCLEAIEHPVVYNGNINSVADFERLASRFPEVRRWMLGRGILIDPSLALAIRGQALSDSDRFCRVHDFVEALYAAYQEQLFGPRPILGRMKELWFYQSRLFVDGATILKRIQRSKTLQAYERIISETFGGKPELVSPSASSGGAAHQRL